MKDYIDLTQLPAEKVEAMVLALSKNDFDLLRKYCDELGILYGYPMEEVVNIFSDQLLLSKKTLTKAVNQMDPESLASRVDIIEETLPTKADLSALNPIQQRVADISDENSEINGRIDEISGNISELNGKITTISTAHDNLAGTVDNLLSDLNEANDKLNTIQDGAEKNTISAIQLNGNSIQPINKTVNLTNVVVTEKLNSVISELNSLFNTKLNTLKAETDGANNALAQDVGNINNTLDSKLDITVASAISVDLSSAITSVSAVLSSEIKSISAVVDTNKTEFDKKLNDINISVLFNKDYIDKLDTADKAISDQIKLTSADLVGFINGRVEHLDDELKEKVSVGDYDFKVKDLDKKDSELADELTKQESHIDALKSEIDRHSRKLDDTITEIFVTSTNSTLRPENGVISIDVATTSIINAQITAMAGVFHATVDELVKHLNEDLSVVSAAIAAKTDLSAFNPVAENVKTLTVSASVNAANILNLSNDISSAVHHCDHLHSNAISLINCLSASLNSERNYRETTDAKLGILIDNESKARTEAVEKERSERVAGDKELDTKIETLTEKLLREYAELQKTHTTDVSKLKETITNSNDSLTTSISNEVKERVEGDQELKASIVELEKTVIKCEAIVNQNKADYQQHAKQIADLNASTAANTANITNAQNAITNLTANLEDTQSKLDEFIKTSSDEIDTISDAIYGNSEDEPGLLKGVKQNSVDIASLREVIIGTGENNGLGNRLATAESNIATLNATTENIDSKLGELSDSITAAGGLISKVTDRVDTHAGIISKNSSDVSSLNKDINSISCTLYGNSSDSTNNGLTAVVNNLIFAIGADSLGSPDSISERLTAISNDLNGNHAVNPDIFGVHDRIEDLENSVKTISGLSTDVSALQISATAVVEKITSVSKDLDETRGWINDLSEKTTRVYEAIYGDDNPLNGLDNIVDELSDKIDEHTKRIEALEKNTVDFSPIYDRLDEVDESLSALSAENDSISFAVETAINSIEALNDRINKLETNAADLSSINGRLDNLETENELLNAAVTEAQNGIIDLVDNFEVRVSDIFVDAIEKLASDEDEDYKSVIDKDEYAAAIKLIDPIGSATINDIVKRLNAIITVINNVAK